MKEAVQALLSGVRWLIRGTARITTVFRSKNIRPDPGWATEVQSGLSFLFTEHCATLVDSTYRNDSFGLKTTVIKVGNMILRVSRDVTLPQDYIEARIAPVHDPVGFKSPVTAWMALALISDGRVPPTPPYKDFGTLEGLSTFLQQNFVQLNEAFSAANYPATRQKMREVEEEHWEQWRRHQARDGAS